MTSDAREECYVYITLPGEIAPVTAGRFQLASDRRGIAEGRFVYGKSYLARANAVPLDPVELHLSNKIYATNSLKGVFGAIRDASPDYWGRKIIERYTGNPQPSEMQYLLNSPDDRAGALGFGLNQIPPAPKRKFNQTLALAQLQAAAAALLAEEEPEAGELTQQVEHLLNLGTSMGGARPKAVVEDAEGLWVAKFNTNTDKWNNARVEHAMLVLARACGITSAHSKVVDIAGSDVLLVKRFDREKVAGGYLCARMVSGLTLLRAEDMHQARDKWSYVLLAEELRKVCTQPAENTEELFRRMCFNALISNTDDHPRNHAAIALNDTWKLSPAYDLTPGIPISNERRDLAMMCGDGGRYANAGNLLTQSRRFLLSPERATEIIASMESIVQSQWHTTARAAGVSESDCRKISGAFAYEGFRHKT